MCCCGMLQNMTIREMSEQDWPEVADIFRQGIETGTATFQSEVPTYAQWDATHIPSCRLVVTDEDLHVVGWAALTPVSSRCAYRGVAEVSIYIATTYRGRKVGKQLLSSLVEHSEKAGYWTLQSVILVDNQASISLHESCGFKLIGRRERISIRTDGTWSDTLLMERRSNVVGI